MYKASTVCGTFQYIGITSDYDTDIIFSLGTYSPIKNWTMN